MAIQYSNRSWAARVRRHKFFMAKHKAMRLIQFATDWLAVDDRAYRISGALFILAVCLAIPAINGDPRHPVHAVVGLLMLAVRP